MTTKTDIANRALQVPGTRTTVIDAELAANSTNEAIQINLVYDNIRRRLLRMAPWDCAIRTQNLVYITSVQGTPENQSPPTTLWQPGQPAPPWAYEYQYPVTCLRMCWLIPATQTGFAGGVPITTAVTGGAASFWQGPPVKFQTQTDLFCPVIAIAVNTPGENYAVGDLITLAPTASTSLPPIGAPAQVVVTSVDGGGGIQAVSLVPTVIDSNPTIGGSYFLPQTNPVPQGTTTGVGDSANFNLTFGPQAPQRVILTNQEYATGVFVADVTDPNIFDDLFQDALSKILGATITIPLTGDKKLANDAIQMANQAIMMARTADANEAMTINDVTPDWMRIRGINIASPYSGPFTGYDWGGMWPTFG
jgi:hypothetical protein